MKLDLELSLIVRRILDPGPGPGGGLDGDLSGSFDVEPQGMQSTYPPIPAFEELGNGPKKGETLVSYRNRLLNEFYKRGGKASQAADGVLQ